MLHFQVEPNLKLPILYLVDSIVKNLKGVYIEFFACVIEKMFCETFGTVILLLHQNENKYIFFISILS